MGTAAVLVGEENGRELERRSLLYPHDVYSHLFYTSGTNPASLCVCGGAGVRCGAALALHLTIFALPGLGEYVTC